jgi:hypothetical protein
MAVANQPLPDYIVDKWLAATITNTIKRADPRVRKIEIDGDAVLVFYGDDEACRYRAGKGVLELREAMKWDKVDKLPDSGMELLPWLTDPKGREI